MKRIIDGVTYNTATATILAKRKWSSGGEEKEDTLYQTNGGAFFLDHESTHYRRSYHYEDKRIRQPDTRNQFEPLTAEAAREWLSRSEAEIYHNPFGEPPEAGTEPESAATVYLRMPGSLKTRIEAAAKSEGQSVNAWALRTFEWRLSNPVLEKLMRSDLGRLMSGQAKELADRVGRTDDTHLADRLIEIGRDCAARLGDEYRQRDHDRLLYDDKGLPR